MSRLIECEICKQNKEYYCNNRCKSCYNREYKKNPEVQRKRREFNKKYRQRPEIKERMKKYRKDYRKLPRVIAQEKEYRNRPEVKEKERLWRIRDRDKIREYHQTPQAKAKRIAREHEPKHIERRNFLKREYLKNPKNYLKWQVRERTKFAIKSGKLSRKPCIKCGNPKVEAHHEEYSIEKAFEVIWLCRECHDNLHFRFAGDLQKFISTPKQS